MSSRVMQEYGASNPDGDWLAARSSNFSIFGSEVVQASVYCFSNGQWLPDRTLRPDFNFAESQFGMPVLIEGQHLLAAPGAYTTDPHGNPQAGALFSFEVEGFADGFE